MAQIQAGVTYATGGQVTATNLNAHVNNAVLVPGAISDQAAAASCTTSDSVLILQSGALKKATIAQVQTSIAPDLTAYVNKNGSVAMTGELTLSSSTPAGSLSAASKTYVDTSLSTGLATKQNTLGFTPVNKAGDTLTGALLLAAAEGADLAVLEVEQVHRSERTLDDFGVVAGKRAPPAEVRVAAHLDEAANGDGEVPIDVATLRQVGDLMAAAGERLATPEDAAAVRPDEASEGL